MVNVAPPIMLPEANDCAPVGTFIDVTVCVAESLLVQATEALTPLTNVVVAGEYPGDAWFAEDPLAIETLTAAAAPVVVVDVDVVDVTAARLQQTNQTLPTPWPTVSPAALSLE